MKLRFVSVSAILFLSLGVSRSSGQTVTPASSPVNPNASPEARALLKYLQSISGRYTLSGQHNYPYHISRWTDRAFNLTGKYPALFGQDFGFSGGEDKDSTEARPELIAEVKRQYRNGAVVTLTWHAVRPTSDEPVTFRENVQSDISDFEWTELLTPGSALYNRWCQQVDVIAGYLKQLRDARVPVLFRPYHEMNGTWFWWGGRPGKNGSAALYRQIFDRFVNHHKLDNLVWVWNVNAPNTNAGSMADYFPGKEYVDLLTVDNYGEFTQRVYDEVLALSVGKPVALGEVGVAPSPEILRQQPKWTYFMLWSEFVDWENSVESLRAAFHAPNTLTRDDPRHAEPMAAIRKASPDPAPELVTPHATPEAKALLTVLHAAAGKSTLAGQENGFPILTAANDRVFQATGSYPMIYSADLGVALQADSKAARQQIVEEAKRQHQKHSIVSLSWKPARPGDDGAIGVEQGARGPLSDFEWHELLTPGTNLNKRWSAQVDAVGGLLRVLQDAGVPVLWQPYPEINGRQFWWAGRKGVRGSAALYRQLFDRMVNTDGLRNLVWVWDAVAPGSGADAPGRYSDFFPGLVYVDALALNLEDVTNGWRTDAAFNLFATGKVIGLGLTGKIPPEGFFARQKNWAWFIATPESTQSADVTEALRKLYDDPQVLSRSEEPEAAGTTASK